MAELDTWIYRNVPGLKTCKCVNWIQRKFGPQEYREIRKSFLSQGSKDRWPEIEPDLPCNHEPKFTSDPAAAMDVLKKCKELIEISINGNEISALKRTEFEINDLLEFNVCEERFEFAICLFAKELFRKEN